jgi:hypothetical protein
MTQKGSCALVQVERTYEISHSNVERRSLNLPELSIMKHKKTADVNISCERSLMIEVNMKLYKKSL